MVYLKTSNNSNSGGCTGSLLTPWYVLTAEHCFSWTSDPSTVVTVTLHDEKLTTLRPVSIKNSIFFSPGKYAAANSPLDVVLLKLDEPVTGLSSYAKFNMKLEFPAKFNSAAGLFNTVFVAGYGGTWPQLYDGYQVFLDDSYAPNIRMASDLSAHFGTTCVRPGDSGAPLMFAASPDNNLMGVVKTQNPVKTMPNICAAYATNIKLFQEWLYDTIWPNQPKITEIDPKSNSSDNKTISIDYTTTSSPYGYRLFYKPASDGDAWDKAMTRDIPARQGTYTFDIDATHTWAMTLLAIDSNGKVIDGNSNGLPLTGNASNYTWYARANPGATQR